MLEFSLFPSEVALDRQHRLGNPSKTQRRRLSHAAAEDPQTDALYLGYGTHFVDLWVGTPVPQRQTVIVDTGSSVTAFPCTGCRDCGDGYHTDSYFDPSLSSSFKTLECDECFRGRCGSAEQKNGNCSLSLSYAEGSSWTAIESRDLLHVGPAKRATEGEPSVENKTNETHQDSSLIPVTFGCQMSLSGLFKTQLADGIMGMSKVPGSFWDQMYKTGKIDHRMFSLCFRRPIPNMRAGMDAGTMKIGGYDTQHHISPIAYATDVGVGNFFEVRIKQLSLRPAKKNLKGEKGGNKDATEGSDHADDQAESVVMRMDVENYFIENGPRTVLDSGTTDTYFSDELLRPFEAAWEEVTGQKLRYDPHRMSERDLLNLPTIVIQLQGVDVDADVDMDSSSNQDTDFAAETVNGNSSKKSSDQQNARDVFLEIPPMHYMTNVRGRYFFGIHMDNGKRNILGANTMQGYDVIFDVDQSRIGFAESTCTSPLHSPAHRSAQESGGRGFLGLTSSSASSPNVYFRAKSSSSMLMQPSLRQVNDFFLPAGPLSCEGRQTCALLTLVWIITSMSYVWILYILLSRLGFFACWTNGESTKSSPVASTASNGKRVEFDNNVGDLFEKQRRRIFLWPKKRRSLRDFTK